jgi:hypothetical protein
MHFVELSYFPETGTTGMSVGVDSVSTNGTLQDVAEICLKLTEASSSTVKYSCKTSQRIL